MILMSNTKIKRIVTFAIVLILFFIGWMIPKFTYSIEHKSHIHLSMLYLTVPFLIIGFILYFKFLTEYRKKTSRSKGIISTIVTALLIALMSSNYLVLINSNLGSQNKVIVEGEIIHRKDNSLKVSAISKTLSLTDYIIAIKDLNSQRILQLEISKEEFAKVESKTIYKDEWYVGSLNLLYKKR